MSNRRYLNRRVITQAQLRELRDARDALGALDKEIRRMRGEMLEDTDAGAFIQPGQLVLEVIEREQRRLSRAGLEEALGVEEADGVIEQLTPIIVRYMIIREREDSGHGLLLPASLL